MSAATWGDLASLIRAISAGLLVALSVKLMDDWLDRGPDTSVGRVSTQARWGASWLPYALVLLAVAAALSHRVAADLFLGAYSSGMAGELGRRQPSGLCGLQGSLLVLVAGAVLVGWRAITAGLLVASGWQVADHLLDGDRAPGPPWEHPMRVLGNGGSTAAALWAFGAASFLDPPTGLAGILGGLAVEIPELWQRQRGRGG